VHLDTADFQDGLDTAAFPAIAAFPAFLVSQAIPVLMASRKAVLADTADSQDFQALVDTLAVAFQAIQEALDFQDSLDTLGLVCQVILDTLAIAALAVIAEILA